MGATGWDYVTPYHGSIEATLEALHEEVFQELYGDGEEYKSREELYADEEFMGEAGTHSILDVYRIVDTPAAPGIRDWDYNTLRPLGPDRLMHHFGTEQPTLHQYEDAMARANEASYPRSRRDKDTTLLDEHELRWTGLYVLLYSDGEPTHIGIFGTSGD
ncbi:hypothetical protein ACWGQ5_44960 [Streptomyces sp. NPDC055722]